MFEGKIHDGTCANNYFMKLPRDLYSGANSFRHFKMGDQLTFRIDRVGGGNVIRPFTIAGFGHCPVDGLDSVVLCFLRCSRSWAGRQLF